MSKTTRFEQYKQRHGTQPNPFPLPQSLDAIRKAVPSALENFDGEKGGKLIKDLYKLFEGQDMAIAIAVLFHTLVLSCETWLKPNRGAQEQFYQEL